MNGLGTMAIYLWMAANFMKSYVFHIQSLEDTAVTGKLIVLPSYLTSSLFCSLFLRRCAQNCLDISWAQAWVVRKEGQNISWFLKGEFCLYWQRAAPRFNRICQFALYCGFLHGIYSVNHWKVKQNRPFEVLLYSGLYYVNLWK